MHGSVVNGTVSSVYQSCQSGIVFFFLCIIERLDLLAVQSSYEAAGRFRLHVQGGAINVVVRRLLIDGFTDVRYCYIVTVQSLTCK